MKKLFRYPPSMPTGDLQARLTRLGAWARPRPHEILVLLNALLVAAVLRTAGHIELRTYRSVLTILPALQAMATLVLIGLVIRILWIAVRDGLRRAVRYLKSWCRPVRLAEAVRVLLFWGAVSWSYTWLKTFLPVTNPLTYDLLFDRLDTLLHFGINPNRFILALLPYPIWWRFVDFTYGLFVPVAFASVGWFLSTLSTSERRRFSARFGLLWILSSWIYLALPARGPCFVFENDYLGARPSMPDQLRTQGILGNQYRILKQGGGTPGPEFVPGWGTAAMPSLHVGALAFLAIWARRKSRVLGLAYAILTVITFIGSLVTGWHYAIDGYAGFLLGAGCALVRWPLRKRREGEAAADDDASPRDQEDRFSARA